METISAGLLIDTLYGYQKTAAIVSAIDLDLFTAIGEGVTTAERLAARLGAAERGVRVLADYLTALRFLTKDGGRYGLTPTSAVLLDRRSPGYIGSVADFMAGRDLRGLMFDDPARVVRAGGARGLANVAPDHPIWITFARAMAPLAARTATALVRWLEQEGIHPRNVLDLAAGHGLYGIAIADAQAQARVTAIDWQGVLEVARENAAARGVLPRYRTLAGCALQSAWGEGYDLILMPNFLHHFDPATCAMLLGKARASLAEGGAVFAIEHVPDDDRAGPLEAVRFAFLMLFSTPAGDAYTAAELDAIARQAGFAGAATAPLPPSSQTLVRFLVRPDPA